ncbi:hypothetical protein GBAR_LOCUS16602 [Geodia barretti]|uniref:Uncharacterized protein n=1 Tax=Geodia barretti TaxID=519541 RepID=A0AA35SFM5_GEOBA|nr:hypothetical protein GBAR_LOCUS16602 [Geodia barretti]
MERDMVEVAAARRVAREAEGRVEGQGAGPAGVWFPGGGSAPFASSTSRSSITRTSIKSDASCRIARRSNRDGARGSVQSTRGHCASPSSALGTSP